MESINSIEKFRAELINVINNSNIHLGTGYYVLKDVFREVEYIYNQTKENELQEEDKTISQEIDLIADEKELEEDKIYETE